MTFGSLFAGIGGFDLGFERAGLRCVWQVEIDPFCRRVLAKHWPEVRRHDDVRTFPPEGDWSCDVVCGGFPCQNISNAGQRAGIDGERSGLWSEYVRIVRVLRPRFVVVENVAALLNRGLERVLGDLAACGYDAEWDCVSAAFVGAPHIRDRVFLVAYPQRAERRAAGAERCELDNAAMRLPDQREEDSGRSRVCGSPVAHPERDRRQQGTETIFGRRGVAALCGRDGGRESDAGRVEAARQWESEPAVGRVANGVPRRVDRLRGLGNAVVPQVAEWIGRQLMEVG